MRTASIKPMKPWFQTIEDVGSSLNWSEFFGNDQPVELDIGCGRGLFLFNAALAELRAFNLPNAETYLNELQQRQPGDSEILRILEFVKTYKSRPVDMRLEIFVGNLSER